MGMPRVTVDREKSRDDRHVASWTAGVLLASLWVGVPWLGSLAAAAPLALYLFKHRGAVRQGLLWRWVATVYFTTLAMVGLGGERALRATISGAWAFDATHAWLGGTGGAWPTPLVLAGAVAAFLAAAVATRGLVAVFVVAELTVNAAVAASVVYARAFNGIKATLVAVPPWTIAGIMGLCVLLSPLRTWGRRPAGSTDEGNPRALIVGASLLVLALLLRLTTASAVTRLAQHLTVP